MHGGISFSQFFILNSAFCILLFSCKEPPEVVTDTREPISVEYVGAPELPVRAAANDTAEVLTTYQNGESVSVLARSGEWVEIRTVGGSGWVKAADLTNASEVKAQEENPTPKFVELPSPVSAPNAKGTIYIEADVNTDGDVTAVKIISNTTDSPALAQNNAAALARAKFHPIVIRGERKPFKYDYRVDY